MKSKLLSSFLPLLAFVSIASTAVTGCSADASNEASTDTDESAATAERFCLQVITPFCLKTGETVVSPNSCKPAGYRARDIAHRGECTTEERPRMCLMVLTPVCLKTGETRVYPNSCIPEADSAEIKHAGECTDEDRPQLCLQVLTPYCLATGETVVSRNSCPPDGYSESEIAHRGACETPSPACDPERMCTQALSCVGGMLYPTGCGPANCDKPIGPC